jgi:hypothetical protein
LATASGQDQRINTKDVVIKNIGGKAKGDNMKTKDKMSITELQTNDLLNTEATAIEKRLKTAHSYYDVKNLLTVLTKFATSEVGANAKVILVLPDGRNPMQKEFNIREITLVENKIIGSKEKYRCAILVD